LIYDFEEFRGIVWYCVGFEVLMPVFMKVAIFWDITSGSPCRNIVTAITSFFRIKIGQARNLVGCYRHAGFMLG
jgi:hypothetical protein